MEVKIEICKYASHATDLVTRRSITGMMIFVQYNIVKIIQSTITNFKTQHMDKNGLI